MINGDNGKKEFVLLPYEEFVQMQEELELLDDLKALRIAKEAEKDSPTVSLADAKKMFNLNP